MINKFDDYSYSAIRDIVVDKLSTTNWIRTIDALRPNDSLTVDISSPEWIDLYLSRMDQFKEIIKESVFILKNQKLGGLRAESIFKNMKVLLISENEIEMDEIKAEKEGQTVCFESIIIGSDAPKTFIKETDVMCPVCFTTEHVRADFERKLRTLKCMNVSCKNAKMESQKTGLVTEDIQTILLQQPLEKATKNSPIIFYGKVVGDQVGTSFVGQKKKVVGIFRSNIEENKDENEVYIDIVSLTDIDDVNEILPSPEEVVKIKQEVKDEDFITKITNSFAPHIYGYDDIKLSCLLQLVGGVPSKKRADINILLVGDPSMAKSELLKYGNIISQRSIYTSGKGTTSAGLTIGMVKLADGRMIAQAGVLPICDNGFAFIDEFDKMSTDDRSSMHEAMEQQTVSIAKAGIVMSLPTRTSILAAANPKYGAYDIEITLRDNINIPAPLLSRFDMIWLIRDKVQQTEDMAKATHILNSFTDDSTDMHYNESQLKAFFNYIRELQPLLAEEAKSKLLHIYEGMRTASAKSQMPVGTRQLEALVRLSMAHAKLHLKDCIDVEDVEAVEDLIKKMYQGFGLSLDTNIQQQIYFDDKNTKQHDAITIWDACKNDEGYVKLKHFAEELQKAGMEEEETKRLIDRWEKNNVIKLNKDGSYERI